MRANPNWRKVLQSNVVFEEWSEELTEVLELIDLNVCKADLILDATRVLVM